jgi:hypothetical protein
MTSFAYHTIRMVATGSLMGREMTPFPDTPHKPDPNSFSSMRNRVMTAETPDKRVELTSRQIHDNLKTCACDVTCVPAWCDYATTLCWRSLRQTPNRSILFSHSRSLIVTISVLWPCNDEPVDLAFTHWGCLNGGALTSIVSALTDSRFGEWWKVSVTPCERCGPRDQVC